MTRLFKSNYVRIVFLTDLGYLVGQGIEMKILTERLEESDLEKIGKERMAYGSSLYDMWNNINRRYPRVRKGKKRANAFRAVELFEPFKLPDDSFILRSKIQFYRIPEGKMKKP